MSPSARVLRSNRQNISIGDASSIVGNVIKEDCVLVQRNGSVWRYNNQTGVSIYPYAFPFAFVVFQLTFT